MRPYGRGITPPTGPFFLILLNTLVVGLVVGGILCATLICLCHRPWAPSSATGRPLSRPCGMRAGRGSPRQVWRDRARPGPPNTARAATRAVVQRGIELRSALGPGQRGEPVPRPARRPKATVALAHWIKHHEAVHVPSGFSSRVDANCICYRRLRAAFFFGRAAELWGV